MDLYINGVRRSDGCVTNTDSITTTVPLYIGRDENVGRGYNSSISNVRIYNRALTDGGVAENATATGEIAKNYRHGTAKHKD